MSIMTNAERRRAAVLAECAKTEALMRDAGSNRRSRAMARAVCAKTRAHDAANGAQKSDVELIQTALDVVSAGMDVVRAIGARLGLMDEVDKVAAKKSARSSVRSAKK